jgi:16S rRNA processing protein RimM
MLSADAWVPLGTVARAHGLRGEVRVNPYNRDSELLLSVRQVLVRPPAGDALEADVQSARPAVGAILIKLRSVDDRDRADDLRGAVVCARRRDFPPLTTGEFYVCDIEGARVLAKGEGGELEELGQVLELREYPSIATLLVRAADGGRPWEVPLVDSVVRQVDLHANLVILSSTQGLERG